jgi:ABC-type branched-subunit amino acid transport system permease subunit
LPARNEAGIEVAVSFNLIFGFTGQLSMFHAAAFGISAYATHLSMKYWTITFWEGMLFAAVLVTLISIVVGAILFPFQAERILLRSRHARLFGDGALNRAQLERCH